MDVKNAFLNGDLSEEVYMTPSPGVSLPTGHVCRLRKTLYGLKQAPRAWFEKFSTTVISLGFSASNYDSGLFTRTTDAGTILLLLYVDGMIITGSDSAGITILKQSLSASFEMKDLGNLHYFLGLEILSDSAGTYLCQAKYTPDLISRAGITDQKVVSTPLEPNLHLTQNAGPPLKDPTLYSLGLSLVTYQKPMMGGGILRELDRVMANSEFLSRFVGASVALSRHFCRSHIIITIVALFGTIAALFGTIAALITTLPLLSTTQPLLSFNHSAVITIHTATTSPSHHIADYHQILVIRFVFAVDFFHPQTQKSPSIFLGATVVKT
ncbi:hypothetical protein OSB04_002734 [Centaurea solstitialis]|uniref:Reverse transcriptase Ty1/copia-type domain-containing protein n=1 Tax=Centaurea solstitialis TaxID=347529 RepID=A0AA38UBP5_9ASTR|nr:hypothetical protein OSB04_002734 [Centaurea solstitialis]